jgi:hypothetical protein
MVPDCTSQIKPAILRLKQDTVAAKNEEEETVIGLEEDISELKNRIASKDVEAQEAETRYKNELAELESTREVGGTGAARISRLTDFLAVAHIVFESRSGRSGSALCSVLGHQERKFRRVACSGAAFASSTKRVRPTPRRR